MNSTLEVIFGLLGGLAVFIFGMNMMSDCLQKAAGEKIETDSCITYQKPDSWSSGRSADNRRSAEQQCDNCYGDRFCKCGTYESAAGNLHHPRSQHRNDDDGTDHCL